jgi:LysM repeat protein
MWAEIWAQHLDDLANWDASALSEAATKETTNSKNPVERRSLSIPCVEHEVRKGDTLYNISKRFEGTTPEQIAETNGIDTVIKIGQILCIPQTE